MAKIDLKIVNPLLDDLKYNLAQLGRIESQLRKAMAKKNYTISENERERRRQSIIKARNSRWKDGGD